MRARVGKGKFSKSGESICVVAAGSFSFRAPLRRRVRQSLTASVPTRRCGRLDVLLCHAQGLARLNVQQRHASQSDIGQIERSDLQNVRQAAELLHVKACTVRNERLRGKLGFVNVGVRIFYTPQHIADYLQRQQVTPCAENQTRPDLASSGTSEFTPLGSITEESFDKIFKVNVLGVLLTTQAAAKHLKEGGGSGLHCQPFLSGRLVDLTSPYVVARAVSKHAVQSSSEVLRLELARLECDW